MESTNWGWSNPLSFTVILPSTMNYKNANWSRLQTFKSIFFTLTQNSGKFHLPYCEYTISTNLRTFLQYPSRFLGRPCDLIHLTNLKKCKFFNCNPYLYRLLQTYVFSNSQTQSVKLVSTCRNRNIQRQIQRKTHHNHLSNPKAWIGHFFQCWRNLRYVWHTCDTQQWRRVIEDFPFWTSPAKRIITCVSTFRIR